jgi:hypothetical protein
MRKPKTVPVLIGIVLALMSAAAPAAADGFRIDIGGGGFAFNLPFAGAPETGQGGECLADRDIRNGLKGHGYADVRLRRDLGGDHVEVLARDDGWIYSMRLDRCNGEVDRIERLRPTLGEGFGFQFDYGTDDKDEQGDLK